MSRISNKYILITGASGGIGAHIAKKVAEQGGNPILVARSEANLQKLQQEIKETYHVQCYYYSTDLTDLHSWTVVLDKIIDEIGSVDAMINNAGFGIFNYVEQAKWQDTVDMFQLNVFAVIKGINHLLPMMIDNRHGHIINIASQAGKIATPKSAIYGATKHAVIGFSNALRIELESKGIYVTTVNLGPVKTNFFDTADPSGTYQQSVERFMIDPNDVAEKVVQALFTQKREINLPKWMDIGTRIYHLFPGLVERLLKKQFNRK